MDEKMYSSRELMILLNLNDIVNFRKLYLNPAIKEGFIKLKYSKNPRHKNKNTYLQKKATR